MDNLLEIIIIAVFVLSGINSLFGSKKKRREKMEEETPQNSSANRVRKLPQDQKVTFEDFFGIPKTTGKTPDPFDEPDLERNKTYPEYSQDYENTWNPEDDFSNSNDKRYSEVTDREKAFDELSKIDYDKFMPAKSSTISSIDHSIKTPVNKKVVEIRKLLKNKSSIKNSIIVAEILSKPKALRFRGNNLHI